MLDWSIVGSTLPCCEFPSKKKKRVFLFLGVLLVVCSEAALLRAVHVLASAAAKASSQEGCATFIKFSSPESMQVSRHPRLKNASALLARCSLN